MKRLTALLQWAVMAVLAVAPSGRAQQVIGESGSPSATTTIDGRQLPPPDPTFGGVINQKASDSKPWWPPRVVPPKGAPNVLLIMTDDCGFGSPSTFGGVIPTPALDRIAQKRAALHSIPFHLAVFTDACRVDHRSQSSRGWLRRRGRSRHRLSGLRFRHPQGVRDGR